MQEIKDMHGGQPRMNSISRRTRSQWDAFYRDRYQQINTKKPVAHQHPECTAKHYQGTNQDLRTTKNPDPVTIEDSCSEDSDNSLHDDSDKKGCELNNNSNNICKSVGKKRKKRGIMVRPAKKTKAPITEEVDLINMLFESRCNEKDLIRENPVSDNLKFKFEDEQEEQCLPEKTDREKEIDSLFEDLEMALCDSEIRCSNFSMSDDECTNSRDIDDDETPAARCGRGQHVTVVDEQIGIVCKYCHAVLLDIKHVLPSFYVESPERREWKYYNKESHNSVKTEIQFEGSGFGNLESFIHSRGTVLDLIPNADKELYPHQLEGFKFLWRNIAGDIHMDKLATLPAKGGRGCIISHAPGTGKTRLTIVFLQAFMKLYPTCRPLIIAPVGLLLTWEQEFKKWNADINFLNLNNTKLSSHETAVSADQTRGHEKNIDYTRLVKLRLWMMGGSVLGISYGLFEQLAGEHDEKRCSNNSNGNLKKILLELPDLLVLDEGHTARSDQSLTWNTLTKVKTRRRVMLSGTPFQNNFDELYNTLSLVNPRFSHQILPSLGHDRTIKTSGRKLKLSINAARDEWANLTSPISKNTSGDDRLKKLRLMIKPFVHIHKGGILQQTLPGMRDYLIILKPTVLQKKLLKIIPPSDSFLEQDHLASLISVHPSLVARKTEFSNHERELKLHEFDLDAGVKTCFLVKLIQLSDRLHEKVLVFSQFLPPLDHIASLLQRHLLWKKGREVICMHGKMGITERQRVMNLFNDKRREAKVLLASQKACSEGINLVGASRVVLLDVVWNPSVERQAICRAYRLGQEKVVHVYRLCTKMEVEKYKRQAEKERVSELLFSPGDEPLVNTTKTTIDSGEDKVLEAMVGHQSLGSMFDKIVASPKDSDFIHNFASADIDCFC